MVPPALLEAGPLRRFLRWHYTDNVLRFRSAFRHTLLLGPSITLLLCAQFTWAGLGWTVLFVAEPNATATTTTQSLFESSQSRITIETSWTHRMESS